MFNLFKEDKSLEDLSISEERYRRLFETAQDGILLLDINTGLITDVNKFLIDMLGYSKSDFLKKHVWEVGLFKNEDEQKENFKILQEKGYVRFENLPLETINGKKINVEFVANSYRVGDETVIQCNIRDITERVKAENKLFDIAVRDEAMLQSLGDAVFACDKYGIITLFNKKSEEMTGIKSADAIGKHFREVLTFVQEEGEKRNDGFIDRVLTTNKETVMEKNTLLVSNTGVKIPVSDSASPIIDSKGNSLGCVVVFHDVTMERSVDKAKTELVALASHQMRTPLTAILWYTELIKSNDYGQLNERQSQFADEIYNAGKRMAVLVNSLLNVSRLEMGSFIIEPVDSDIVGLAKNNVSIFKTQIYTKKIDFVEEYDPEITSFLADPKLLGILFQNIISNAIKYTPPGGKVTLSIKKEADNLNISLADNGYGIPKNDQDKIFNKLYRAENAKIIDPTGNGLGLYIVKEIISHSGGKIWFDSKVGKGTTFYISYPLTGMSKKEGDKFLVS